MTATPERLDDHRAGLAAALRDPRFDRWRGRRHTDVAERIADHAAMVAVLDEAGWTRYGWPPEVGGLGGDVTHRAALYDELVCAGLPIPETHLLLETLGPPTIRFAPDLAAALLPGCLAGREWWSQGFSEPEAGSDLAALRTTARRTPDGDFVVTGQKIWQSHGATAHRLCCLVRTGSPESRHRGLTMMLLDRDAPGVSVRPVALAGGEEELAEVFLDDVVVPGDRVIGDVDGGWAVTMYLMQFERSMYAWQKAIGGLGHLQHAVDLVAAGDGPPRDGLTRRIGEVHADLLALRSRSAATLRALAAGHTIGPGSSVDKILLARADTGVHDLVRDVLGDAFLFDDDAARAGTRGTWWLSRSATILGGSSEVQRSILADHVLGLPREATA